MRSVSSSVPDDVARLIRTPSGQLPLIRQIARMLTIQEKHIFLLIIRIELEPVAGEQLDKGIPELVC